MINRSSSVVYASLDDAMTGPNRRSPVRALLLLAGLVACLRYLLAEVARLKGGLGFPLDDSWIHLQFARNLAHGAGLSYNPGDLVTGSTAPLWTALLAAPLPAAGERRRSGPSSSASLLYLAGIDATWRLSRELGLGRGARGARLGPHPGDELARLVGALGDGDPALHPALALGDDPPPARAGRPGPPAALPRPSWPSPSWPGRRGCCCCCSPSSTASSSSRTIAARSGTPALAPSVPPGPARRRAASPPAPWPAPSSFTAGRAAPSCPRPTRPRGAARCATSCPTSATSRTCSASSSGRSRGRPCSPAGGAAALAGRLGTPRDRGLLPALWLFGHAARLLAADPRPHQDAGQLRPLLLPALPGAGGPRPCWPWSR